MKGTYLFFFNDTATTEIYTLSLHDALPICSNLWASGYDVDGTDQTSLGQFSGRVQQTYKHSVPRFFVPEHGTECLRSEERFSRNAETDLVCRLLLEKKKTATATSTTQINHPYTPPTTTSDSTNTHTH